MKIRNHDLKRLCNKCLVILNDSRQIRREMFDKDFLEIQNSFLFKKILKRILPEKNFYFATINKMIRRIINDNNYNKYTKKRILNSLNIEEILISMDKTIIQFLNRILFNIKHNNYENFYEIHEKDLNLIYMILNEKI